MGTQSCRTLLKIHLPKLQYFRNGYDGNISPSLFIITQVESTSYHLHFMQLSQSKKVVVFTGAGISTSCGIPDFRGPSGIWTLQRAHKPIPEFKVSFGVAKPSLTHQVRLCRQPQLCSPHHPVSTGICTLINNQCIHSLCKTICSTGTDNVTGPCGFATCRQA